MKKTLILAVVFAGLVAAYYATREERIVSDELKVELPKVDVDTVDRIEVSGTNKVTLIKKGEGWTLEDGGQAADPEMVKKALDALGELKIKDQVSQIPEKHATYEVDDEKGAGLKVKAGGKVVLDIVMGKWTSDFKGSYLRMAGRNDVFAANKNVKSLFSKPAKSWRDLGLAKFERDDATELTFSSGGANVTLSRPAGTDGGTGEWKITAPAELPADFVFDPKKVDRILGTLSNLRATDSIDEKAEKEAVNKPGADGGTPTPPADLDPNNFFGLEPAAASVTVKLKDGSTTTVSVGRAKNEGGDRYAKSTSKAGIYQLTKWTAQNLEKSVDDFREFTISNVKAAEIESFTLTQGKNQLSFARKDGNWSLGEVKGHKKPKDFELEVGKVDSLAGAFSFFLGDEYVQPQPEAAAAGLAKPTAVMVGQAKDGSEVRIEIGARDEAKKGYLARGKDTPIFFIKEWRAKRILDKKLEDYQVKAAN